METCRPGQKNALEMHKSVFVVDINAFWCFDKGGQNKSKSWNLQSALPYCAGFINFSGAE